VNDVEHGPFRSVLDAIPTEAERQQIEYVPGLPESLWSFFKTAEFWREDLLLTPVLILDQFEELFTLQSEPARAHFLDQLSYLTRGVRPPASAPSPADDLSEHPPSVRIVLSLREDYLGFLEEAAEHIPQILDSRYRLAPLDLQAAREAIVGPAGVSDPDLETRPFTLERDAISAILSYLSQRRTTTVAETRRYVEPFQLQLTCRRIEAIATARQKASAPDRPITMADIGGEAALSETLRHFYGDAIRAVPDRRSRRASRRLCEDYLISPEGRRLSLEQDQIGRQLDLSEATLGQLVAGRLLRSEKRSDSTYYELSHDALVEPILATKRKSSLIVGWFGVGIGVLLLATSCLTAIVFGYGFSEYERAVDPDAFVGEVIAIILVGVGILGIFVSSIVLLRSSARSVFRYRRAREAALDSSRPARQRGGLVPGLAALAAGVMVGVLGLVLLFILGLIVAAVSNVYAFVAAQNLELAEYVQEVAANGIGLDTIVYFVAAAAAIMVGARLARWGLYKLARYPAGRTRRSAGATDRKATGSTLHGVTGLLFGGIFLVSAVLMIAFLLLMLQCAYVAPGVVPEWLPPGWFDFVAVDCREGYPEGIAEDLGFSLPFLVAVILCALSALRRGLAGVRRRVPRAAAPAIAPQDG
jgi:hypothetical protein